VLTTEALRRMEEEEGGEEGESSRVSEYRGG